MDGYTYMIERHKLLIRHERERAERSARGPGDPEGPASPTADPFRNRLMDLYATLEGCGRLPRSAG